MILSKQETITITELGDFLDGIHAKQVCPFCSCDTWHVPTNPESPQEVIVENGKWSAICVRCGFIREHSIDLFREWRDKESE